MKKLFFAAVVVFLTAFSANAQVKIESPHPDLDVRITRCAYASGTVVVDMVITNFGADEDLTFITNMSDYKCISMYDDEGNRYDSSNSRIKFGLPNKALEGRSKTTFPQDIPVKFRFQFENISANASKFALLNISMRSNGAMDFDFFDSKSLKIRNLEWEK